MKTKIKARRMWANHYSHGRLGIYRTKRAAAYFRGLFDGESIPVAVIPLHQPTDLGDSMVSALTDLGVLPKRKGGRK
jgi:hypothetical protein